MSGRSTVALTSVNSEASRDEDRTSARISTAHVWNQHSSVFGTKTTAVFIRAEVRSSLYPTQIYRLSKVIHHILLDMLDFRISFSAEISSLTESSS